MKKVLKVSGVALIIMLAITGYVTEYAKVTAHNIAGSVLRLHVVANSDEKYDQELKLAVRDEIIAYTGTITKEAKNREETKNIIENNITKINQIASETIKNNGYQYESKTRIGKSTFPTKHYGDITFPAGEYEALIVTIGKGEGKNWWCVLYPQLCINNRTQQKEPSDNNFAELSEESKMKLKNVLTKEEYNLISNSNDNTVKLKFKLLEVFSKLI